MLASLRGLAWRPEPPRGFRSHARCEHDKEAEQPAAEQQEDGMPANLPMQANVPEQAPTIRQSRRVRWQPSRYQDEYHGRMAAGSCEFLTDEPQSFAEVKERKYWSLWETSLHEELSALPAKGVDELVALPDGKKALPCRWVYKVKRDEQGRVGNYKSRIGAKGFLQRGEQFSSHNLYAPTSNMSTLRVLLSLAAQEDLEVHQLDVKTSSHQVGGLLEWRPDGGNLYEVSTWF
jgi:hypothetical protein